MDKQANGQVCWHSNQYIVEGIMLYHIFVLFRGVVVRDLFFLALQLDHCICTPWYFGVRLGVGKPLGIW